MTLEDWIPALTVPVLLGVVGFLGRAFILERLKGAIGHEYNVKLHDLKAELEGKQSALKADLQAKQAQLDTFRSAVLSGVTTRQAAVDIRRLDAVDQLWEAFRQLGFAKIAATVISTIKFEALLAEAERNPKAKELVMPFAPQVDKMADVGHLSHKARLYLSPLSWAYFSAYQAIVMYAVVQMEMLKNGLNKPKLLKSEHVVKLANAALPGYEHYLAEHGTSGAFYLLDELESKLIAELRFTIKEGAGVSVNVEQVSAILGAVDEVNKDVTAAKVDAAR